ncbi:MAG: DNA mismatch repair endonuclease MutL [Acidobacteriota bacterium]|nr:DNA mismatch repair endonuclease MutL [Acidobacteriota bacterium]
MGRIRVLSDTVANKIAAGEVVERPASVIKELLENSLDAGATQIRIEIDSGGRRMIRIADDGSGMMRDDALLAFERHATSKLSDVKDLLSIATLGFRGEALPSIASVSRLSLETRAAGEATGTFIEFAGGKLLKCEEYAAPSGTVITVRDLFFNVPARKKFLRSDQTELAHIASLVTHYSLAHPGKSFQLRNGPVNLLDVTPVELLRERVYQVFGSRILDDLIDLGTVIKDFAVPAADEPETRTYALRGFVSQPQVQKLNRNSIFLFVNGRLIRDRLLMHALSSAYHNLMPSACYPFALLFLDCDCEEVDVNVHPSKTEVRFRHGSFVHDFVRDSIRQILIASRPVSSIPVPAQPQTGAGLPYSDFTERIENQRFESVPDTFDSATRVEDLPVFTLKPGQGPEPRFDFTEIEAPVRASSSVPDTHGPLPAGIESALPMAQGLGVLSDLRPLGQIHNSFIIAAGRDGLWIIDQHVAHERILFEQVLKQQAEGRVESQQLLIPPVLELTAAQQIEYARLAGELARAGFDTEPFGSRTIAVKAAPAGIGPADIEKLLFEILESSEREHHKVSLDDLRRGMAASIACRAAIKINMRLDQSKMEWLLRELSATDCPMSCPHGRPIALRYSTHEILKSFHRI